MPNPRIDTCPNCGTRNHRKWHPHRCRECNEPFPDTEFEPASKLPRVIH